MSGYNRFVPHSFTMYSSLTILQQKCGRVELILIGVCPVNHVVSHQRFLSTLD